MSTRRFSPECVIACVGSSPFSDRLIRTAKRVADSLDAEAIALHVESGDAELRDGDRQHLRDAYQLAEEIGARVVTIRGGPVADEIARYAREHHAIKIVVGRSLRPALFRLIRPSVADRLGRRMGTVDLYVIGTTAPHFDQAVDRFPITRRWIRYAGSVLLVVAVTIAELPLRTTFSPANLVMPYFIAAIIIALRWGQAPAILSAVAGTILFDYCYIPPYLTFAITDIQYVMTLFGLLAVSLVTAALAGQVKEQANAAALREAFTAALYSLGRSLAVSRSLDQTFQVVERHVKEVFRRRIVILLPDEEELAVRFLSEAFSLGDAGREAASRVFATGRSIDAEDDEPSTYLPLTTSRGIVGVMGLQEVAAAPEETRAELLPEHFRLLEAVASQVASAIERDRLSEKAREAQLLEETDRLQQALLHSISHNLRTPLASITGALSSLSEDSVRLGESGRRELVDTARHEAERLNRLVGDLLDMTRLEAGAMRVQIEPCDVQDVIQSAIAQLGEPSRTHPIVVDAPPMLPLVPMDFVLIAQALVNVLDNAVKYSPPGAPIAVRAEARAEELEIAVTDRGAGIPAADLDRVFDKFYRGRPNTVTGSGLGLSICKGFVEAHGGRIRAERHPLSGTTIRVTLPRRRRPGTTP